MSNFKVNFKWTTNLATILKCSVINIVKQAVIFEDTVPLIDIDVKKWATVALAKKVKYLIMSKQIGLIW